MSTPVTGVVGAVTGENPQAAVPAANKGEAFTSFDVDAFEIPGGRDEVWRFTPLRRLRGLHNGTAVADGSATVTVDGPDTVTVETVGREIGRAHV